MEKITGSINLNNHSAFLREYTKISSQIDQEKVFMYLTIQLLSNQIKEDSYDVYFKIIIKTFDISSIKIIREILTSLIKLKLFIVFRNVMHELSHKICKNKLIEYQKDICIITNDKLKKDFETMLDDDKTEILERIIKYIKAFMSCSVGSCNDDKIEILDRLKLLVTTFGLKFMVSVGITLKLKNELIEMHIDNLSDYYRDIVFALKNYFDKIVKIYEFKYEIAPCILLLPEEKITKIDMENFNLSFE